MAWKTAAEYTTDGDTITVQVRGNRLRAIFPGAGGLETLINFTTIEASWTPEADEDTDTPTRITFYRDNRLAGRGRVKTGEVACPSRSFYEFFAELTEE